MKAITDLEAMGYKFTVDGDKLRAVCDGDLADADKVRSLLGYVKRHRDEALVFLRERAASHYPLVLRFPAAAHVAVVNGQWKRESDGSILATFASQGELASCLVASGCDKPEVLEVAQ